MRFKDRTRDSWCSDHSTWRRLSVVGWSTSLEDGVAYGLSHTIDGATLTYWWSSNQMCCTIVTVPISTVVVSLMPVESECWVMDRVVNSFINTANLNNRAQMFKWMFNSRTRWSKYCSATDPSLSWASFVRTTNGNPSTVTKAVPKDSLTEFIQLMGFRKPFGLLASRYQQPKPCRK